MSEQNGNKGLVTALCGIAAGLIGIVGGSAIENSKNGSKMNNSIADAGKLAKGTVDKFKKSK